MPSFAIKNLSYKIRVVITRILIYICFGMSIIRHVITPIPLKGVNP
nr:MAG TPA: hypothetical protein [Caudoviricetes sp.]